MKKKTPSKKIATRTPLPLELKMMAAAINEHNITELRLALAVARQALAVDDYADSDHVEAYITEYAEKRGPFVEAVQRAIAVDPGNIDGDLSNAYSTPALLAGMALAWLMLREGGAR